MGNLELRLQLWPSFWKHSLNISGILECYFSGLLLHLTSDEVYVFAVLFTQTINTAVNDMDTSCPELQDVKRYFGSLVNTMLSLFMSIAGGVSWEAVIAPLGFISPLWALLFLFYISPLGLHVCVFFPIFLDCMQPSFVKSKFGMFEPSVWSSLRTQSVVARTVVWRLLANIIWETGQTTGIEFSWRNVCMFIKNFVCWATNGFQQLAMTSKVYIFCSAMALPGNFGFFFAHCFPHGFCGEYNCRIPFKFGHPGAERGALAADLLATFCFSMMFFHVTLLYFIIVIMILGRFLSSDIWVVCYRPLLVHCVLSQHIATQCFRGSANRWRESVTWSVPFRFGQISAANRWQFFQYYGFSGYGAFSAKVL